MRRAIQLPVRLTLLLAVLVALCFTGCIDAPNISPYRSVRETDSDGDGVPNDVDNCPSVYNPRQHDHVGDGIGDACRTLQGDPDRDRDGIPDAKDNCPNVPNASQHDSDGDGFGDACDPDIDGDGIPNELDSCPTIPDTGVDTDGDGIDDACDPDIDGDGVPNEFDNCPFVPNPDQNDTDNDKIGDDCDDLLEMRCGPNEFLRKMLAPDASASWLMTENCDGCTVESIDNLVQDTVGPYAKVTLPEGLRDANVTVRATLDPSIYPLPPYRIIGLQLAESIDAQGDRLKNITIHTNYRGARQESFNRTSIMHFFPPAWPKTARLFIFTSRYFDEIDIEYSARMDHSLELEVHWICLSVD